MHYTARPKLRSIAVYNKLYGRLTPFHLIINANLRSKRICLTIELNKKRAFCVCTKATLKGFACDGHDVVINGPVFFRYAPALCSWAQIQLIQPNSLCGKSTYAY